MGNAIGLLILRLGFGANLVYLYGWDKLSNFSEMAPGFPDPAKLAEFLPGVSDGPAWSLGLTVFAQFFCAILAGLGFLTRFFAMFIVGAYGLFIFYYGESWREIEISLLYMLPYLALIFTGPGRLSVDHMLWKRKHTAEKL